jgi:CubicO group peptidase (beta-lactamase class C family)
MNMETVAPEHLGFSSARLSKIRTVMQRFVDRQVVPGMITLLARHGEVAHLECFGVMDVKAQSPMRPDAIFRVYSMTKPITSVATMMLIEDGLVQLNDPVAQYVPAFGQAKVFVRHTEKGDELADLQRDITIHDLLTHTAGLSYGFFDDTPVDEMYRQARLHGPSVPMLVPLEEMASRLASLPLVHQPGRVWRYSMADDLLGYLVGVVSGQPFARFLAERIFKPLAMLDSAFYVSDDRLDRLVTLYSATPSGALIAAPQASIWRDPTAPPSGGGGLMSTAADYLRFAQMLLNGGSLDGVRLLSRKTVELMTRNHLPASMLPFAVNARYPQLGYGYGLGVGVLMSAPQAGELTSEGAYYWNGAAKTRWWNDPKEDLVGLMMVQVLTPATLPTIEAISSTFRTLVYQALDI